jgi:hypothetical protein
MRYLQGRMSHYIFFNIKFKGLMEEILFASEWDFSRSWHMYFRRGIKGWADVILNGYVIPRWKMRYDFSHICKNWVEVMKSQNQEGDCYWTKMWDTWKEVPHILLPTHIFGNRGNQPAGSLSPPSILPSDTGVGGQVIWVCLWCSLVTYCTYLGDRFPIWRPHAASKASCWCSDCD